MRYTQPQSGTPQIDHSNPLGARVIEYLPLVPGMRGSVHNSVVTIGTGGSFKATPKGLSIRGSGAGSRASVPLDLSTKNKITVAFWLYWDAFANDDALALEFGATYTTNAGFLIDPNASGVSGQFMAGVGNAGGSNLVCFPRPSAAVWHRITLAMDRTTGTAPSTMAWVDGVRQTITTPLAATAPSGNFASDTLNLLSRNGTSLLGTGNLQDLTFYDGVFSDSDAAADYRNPWQLFRSPQRVMLVSAGGGTNTPVNPGVGALALTGYSPSVAQSANQSLTPGAGSISITGYAPTIAQPSVVSPGVGSLAIAGYAPTVTQAANQAVTPGTGSLALTGYAPAVVQTAGQWVVPGAGLLAISGYAPTIAQPQTVEPGLGSLAITGYAPTVTQAINQSIVPGSGALALSGYAPSIAQSANQLAQPAAGSLSLTGYAPLVAQSVNQSIAPSAGSLTITGFAPVITQVAASPNLQPGAGMLSIVGYAPTVEQRDPSASVGGGGAGDWRSVRDFADRLDKVHAKPTKAAKKKRRKQIEEEVLELLPDEPESRLVASVIAQAVYRKEAAAVARWTPPQAMQPVIQKKASAVEQAAALEAEAQVVQFDATEAIRAMVEQWQENEAIALELEREAEDESEIEILLLG